MSVADLIAEHLASGRDQHAYRALCAAFAWPAGKGVTPAALPRFVELFAMISEQRGAQEIADLAMEVVRDPDSPDKLYDLGYAMIDAGSPQIAASVLWRCLALVGDSEEVVCELVSALESSLAHRDAFEILDQHVALRTRSFICRYLHAFDAAMTGDLAIARRVLPSLRRDPAAAHDNNLQMIATLEGILERADRLTGATPLDDRDLRGWQYVIAGTVLLHQSPFGFDEPMRGRYAYLVDSIARVATGLRRLAALVRDLELPCVYAVPGRGGEIIGIAASKLLGLPLAPWPAIGVPTPGLLVAYDLASTATPRRSRTTSSPARGSTAARSPTISSRGSHGSSSGCGRWPRGRAVARGAAGRFLRAASELSSSTWIP
ncbi:MAG: hypothetical protein NT062_20790 [Proteobacteria bacterium]|nr:hypothetical protein [Pseudomonadota bacterium]